MANRTTLSGYQLQLIILLDLMTKPRMNCGRNNKGLRKPSLLGEKNDLIEREIRGNVVLRVTLNAPFYLLIQLRK